MATRSRTLPPSIVYPSRLRRHPIAAGAALLLLTLAILDRGLGLIGQGDDYERYHTKVFPVANVVDGDTLDVEIPDGRSSTTRIRLWGVDSPEVAGDRSGADDSGRQASDFATDCLLGRSVRIVLSPTRSRDDQGRLLAYAYIEPDGECFNERLLETGHAYADRRVDHPRAMRFHAIERRARRQGVGLWAQATSDPLPPRRPRADGD